VAGLARYLHPKTTSLARGAYPQRRSRCPLQTVLGAHLCWSKTPLPTSAFCSTGKVRMILPHAMIVIAQRQAQCNRQNIRWPSRLFAGKTIIRHVTFACTIARPQARDMPSSGHPAPTSLYCQPDRIHLPAPHQANPPSAQHSAGDQEWAETARQGSLTVPFTARTSPVQATSRAGQPAPAVRRYFFNVHSICAKRHIGSMNSSGTALVASGWSGHAKPLCALVVKSLNEP